MRIGIMTFHNIPNIGAILQAYSLCKFLRLRGQECFLIDYTCENIRKRELVFKKGRNAFKNIIRYIFYYIYEKRKIIECQDFIKQENMYSRHYDKCDDDLNKDFDVFLSGSDMIWNLNFTDHDWSYYLDFLSDKKVRYSYASSIGDSWEEKDLEKVYCLLSKYKMLASREYDTSIFLTKHLGKTCHWVPDPTVLLHQEYWHSLVKKISITGYVLVYFPYQEILNAAMEYSKLNNLKVVVINNGFPIIKKRIINKAVFNPIDWLNLINGADAVFTDSYHGFLFSLYFNKPVWTNNSSNRFETLIQRLNLEKCYISRDKNFENVIDYEEINTRLATMRKVGKSYLDEMISDAHKYI